ncbi:MAG: HAMP domain-containing histidine kinase, partial [Deltaproteobacteria bacterium]|nr:HAMP domain-containing histidine kinase [Deltaproteobacteria bacterium]
MDRKLIEQYRLSLFGRMAMGVAHEVDNHLSVVIGFSEIIQIAASNTQKVTDSAGKILAAGERIAALIKRYSQYVRPHSPERECYAPAEMISDLLLFAKYDLGRNGSVVELPSPYPTGLLQGDRRDLALVILALLFNAAEAMAEKSGTISIGVSRDDAEWVFTISDMGPGIPRGSEEKVFEEDTPPGPSRSAPGWGCPSRGASSPMRGERSGSRTPPAGDAWRRSACPSNRGSRPAGWTGTWRITSSGRSTS